MKFTAKSNQYHQNQKKIFQIENLVTQFMGHPIFALFTNSNGHLDSCYGIQRICYAYVPKKLRQQELQHNVTITRQCGRSFQVHGIPMMGKVKVCDSKNRQSKLNWSLKSYISFYLIKSSARVRCKKYACIAWSKIDYTRSGS